MFLKLACMQYSLITVVRSPCGQWMLLRFQSSFFFGFEGPDEVVGPEGMEKFCEDIGVEPENVGFLHDTINTLKGGTG